MGSRQRQSLSLLPMVPLAAPLVVGLRVEPLSRRCRIPGPLWGRCPIPRSISCRGKAALLLACQALSPVIGQRVARELTNLGKRR